MLTRTLLSQGYDTEELARMERAGALTRIRRGAYARTVAADETPEDRHRRLIRATMPLLDSRAVISHASAAARRTVDFLDA